MNDATYSSRVTDSLTKLARLVRDKDLNVEVRFYKAESERDFEVFRCMFINNKICLLSYNSFGRGEGREHPQLLLRNFDDADDTTSFYHAFKTYYEKKWADADEWSPEEFN